MSPASPANERSVNTGRSLAPGNRSTSSLACFSVIAMMRSVSSSISGCRLRSVEVASSPMSMPTSRSAIRVSSETRAPSRAYGAMPAEVIVIRCSKSSASSSRRRICSAITLRAVLAAQMNRMERKRGSRGAALLGFFSAVKNLHAPAHHLAHALFLGDALGQLFLELGAEFRRLPHRAFLRNLGAGVPSAHQPHVAHADAEHFAVNVLGVVAREPCDQRRDMRGRERVPLAFLLRHAARGLRRRIDREARARDWRDGIGGDAVAAHLAIHDYR